MLAIQKDGKCVKWTTSVSHLHKISHNFSSSSGLIKLSIHSAPMKEEEMNDNVMDISLPLPFGSKIHCFPVVFSWDQPNVLKQKDLETLLKRLIDEQTKNLCENFSSKPYTFSDTLNISSSNVANEYESEEEELDDEEIYEDISEEEQEENEDQSSEDEEEEEFDDS